MIRVFVVCHKPTYVLNNELLNPIQVGAKLAKERIPGMLYDDTGENISYKNPMYCELTAQYWAWKNAEAEYYGFFHYRRYMSFDKVYPVDYNGKLKTKHRCCPYEELDDIRESQEGYGLEEEQMRKVVECYDILTVLREKINTTVYRQYCQYHNHQALDNIIEILKKKYPEYAEAADDYMNSKEIYYMNMFIMKKPLFEEYASWLFNILESYEKTDDYVKLQGQQKRLMGYLGERLFGIFYTYQRNKGVLCAELPYLKFYNTEIDKNREVENQTNIRTFRLKPTKYEITIDMRKLNRAFPAGSRRRILLRNIFLR